MIDTMTMLRERLQELNAAIRKIEEGGQEYKIGNRMLRRGDLGAMYAERRRLQNELAMYENGGGTYVGAFYR